MIIFYDIQGAAGGLYLGRLWGTALSESNGRRSEVFTTPPCHQKDYDAFCPYHACDLMPLLGGSVLSEVDSDGGTYKWCAHPSFPEERVLTEEGTHST